VESQPEDDVSATGWGRVERLPLPAPIIGILRSDFAQKVAETFGTRIFLIVINAVNTILIARQLGPEGRGQYAVAIAVSAIAAQALTLGLQTANTYFVARDKSLLGPLTSNSLAIGIAVTVIGGAAAIFFALVPGAAPIPTELMTLAIATVPPTLLVLNLRYLLLGVHEVRAYNMIDLVSGVAGMAMTLTLALTGAATPASLLGVAIAMALIALGVAVRGLRPYLDRLPRPSGELLKSSSAYGFRVYLTTAFGLLVLKSDLLVVQVEDGSEASGLYSVASSIADLLWILPSVVGAILFPRLSALPASPERWRLTLRTTAGTMVAFVPILVVTAAVAPVAIRIMFGSDFEPAAASLRILCGAILFYGATSIFSQFLAARGFPWIVVAIWAAGFAVNLVLNLLLVPPLGIEGAALASLISYAFVFGAILLTSVRAAADDRIQSAEAAQGAR
jgi:O-antigen/teichoic acid export membrane protein